MKRLNVMIILLLMTTCMIANEKGKFEMCLPKTNETKSFYCDVSTMQQPDSSIRYTKCSIFLYTPTENAKVRVTIDSNEVPRFIEFLYAVKDKYQQWDSIAKTNNVKAFMKKMPIEMKSKDGIWCIYFVEGKPARSTFDMDKEWQFFIPFFSVDREGRCFVEWNTSDLEYSVRGGLHGLGNVVEIERCEGGVFRFSSVEQIQSLIDCFGKCTEVDNRKDALFK